jgi:Putative papain-like cysteine peptidase (DUF1796)
MGPIFKHILKFVNRIINPGFSEIYWLSLGENCLPDGILKRYGLKIFSTPFSNGQSNLDYVLLLEKSRYKGFLDKENLKYEQQSVKRFTRSKLTNKCDNIYVDYHMRGFGTSYFDLISSDEHRQSFERKIKRLLSLRGKGNSVFFYHYRFHEQQNLGLIFEKAFEYSGYYSKRSKKCHVVVFSQKIIGDISDKGLHYQRIRNNIHFFNFHTEKIWAGNDPYIFWARPDEDLIKKMIDTTIRIVKLKELIPDGIIQ